jgi:hypothetical protein
LVIHALQFFFHRIALLLESLFFTSGLVEDIILHSKSHLRIHRAWGACYRAYQIVVCLLSLFDVISVIVRLGCGRHYLCRRNDQTLERWLEKTAMDA